MLFPVFFLIIYFVILSLLTPALISLIPVAIKFDFAKIQIVLRKGLLLLSRVADGNDRQHTHVGRNAEGVTNDRIRRYAVRCLAVTDLNPTASKPE